MIKLTHFDKKLTSGFFLSVIVVLIFGLALSVLQSPSLFAATETQVPLIPFITENINALNVTIFILSEIVVPGFILWFALNLVFSKVKLFQNSLNENSNSEGTKNLIVFAITFIIVGNHTLAIYNIIPLLFDPIQVVKNTIPGISWFLLSFFLVTLISGVLDGEREKTFTKLSNNVFFIIAMLLIGWVILSPFPNMIANIIKFATDINPRDLALTEYILQNVVVVGILLVILIVKPFRNAVLGLIHIVIPSSEDKKKGKSRRIDKYGNDSDERSQL